MRSARPPQDRKFGCPKCEKKFFTPKDLRRHENTHLGLREHACPSCNQRFGRKDHLTRHAKKSCSATKITSHHNHHHHHLHHSHHHSQVQINNHNNSHHNHNHNNNNLSNSLSNNLSNHNISSSISLNGLKSGSNNHHSGKSNHLLSDELGAPTNRNNHSDALHGSSFASLMPIAMSTQSANDLRPNAANNSKPSFCEDKIVYYNHQYQYDALNNTSSSSYSSNFSPYGTGGGGATGAANELLQSQHHHQRSATQPQSTLIPTGGLQDQQYQINPTSPQQQDLFHVSANYASNLQCYYQTATDYGY